LNMFLRLALATCGLAARGVGMAGVGSGQEDGGRTRRIDMLTGCQADTNDVAER
jgi:hypothetical protein